MKRFNFNSFVLVVAMVLCASMTAQGAIIDTFSSDSSALYNHYLSYDPAGYGPALYGRVDNQFVPTVGTPEQGNFGVGTEDLWLRNDYTFSVGDTISVDLVALSGSSANGSGGLTLSQNPGTNRRYFMITRGVDDSYVFEAWGASTIALTDFSFTNPATISATRTSDTGVSFAVSYTDTNNLSASVTGTCSPLVAGTCYFGMEKSSPINVVPTLDNLATSAAVPEPSALVLLTGLLIGLLAYAWRKRR